MILSLIRGLLGGRTQPTPRIRQGNASHCDDGLQQGHASPVTPRLGEHRPEAIFKPAVTTKLPPPPEVTMTKERAAVEPIVLSFRLAIPHSPKRLHDAALASPSLRKSSTREASPATESATAPCPPPNEITSDDRMGPACLPRHRRSMSLRAAGLGSAAQRRALRSLEIRTTNDLLTADPSTIAQRLELSPAAVGTLRRWQRAIRLSRRLPAMTPREALLLQAVHRGSLRRIGEESALRLHRDLARYALSTAGGRLLAGNPLPSPERVKGWVEAARKRIAAKSVSLD